MAMTAAGRRNRRIVIQRATKTSDDHGEDVPSWATWCSPFANVRFGTSAERRSAASEQGSQAATFRVLATAKTRDVTVQDRITFDGGVWDIEGIAPIDRTEVEFTAVRQI